MSGSLDPQGPVAAAMADLWWLMLVLGTLVFLLFGVLLARGLRRGPNADEELADEDRRLIRRWLVGGGVVLPGVVLTVVLAATLWAMRATPAAPDDALVIEVVGHQWWWEIRYPEQGVTTANEIHMPVGRPVVFELTSADVIHSFWVPALGGKMDMLPERVNAMTLQADRPGRHRSQCAEFCGLQHARMAMIVVAEPAEDFDAWLEANREPAATPAGARAERGREVFARGDCARCHTIGGVTEGGVPGPDLTHLASRETLAAGTLDNTAEQLRRFLADPQAVKPGIGMPVPELTDEELDDLVAYLQGLQ